MASSPTLNLTKPAFIASIAYLVLAFIVLLPLNIGTLDPNYPNPQPYNFWFRLLVVIVMLIPIALSIYSINCMMVGKCLVWSYINVIFICIWVLFFLTAALIQRHDSQQ